jgi:hypothetical protein
MTNYNQQNNLRNVIDRAQLTANYVGELRVLIILYADV